MATCLQAYQICCKAATYWASVSTKQFDDSLVAMWIAAASEKHIPQEAAAPAVSLSVFVRVVSPVPRSSP